VPVDEIAAAIERVQHPDDPQLRKVRRPKKTNAQQSTNHVPEPQKTGAPQSTNDTVGATNSVTDSADVAGKDGLAVAKGGRGRGGVR
jgi:hypothetical protein